MVSIYAPTPRAFEWPYSYRASRRSRARAPRGALGAKMQLCLTRMLTLTMTTKKYILIRIIRFLEEEEGAILINKSQKKTTTN